MNDVNKSDKSQDKLDVFAALDERSVWKCVECPSVREQNIYLLMDAQIWDMLAILNQIWGLRHLTTWSHIGFLPQAPCSDTENRG